MQDFEKLGLFYLGKEFDAENQKTSDGFLLYDSRDLVTHAVCLGMTGSGKTGLCVTMLEEAAIDGIPALVIDPKGDISNLLLTFPDLKPDDFLPWINYDEARKEQMTEQAFAEKQAIVWRKGISEWGQNPERIKLLKNSAEFRIYTPGSSAGYPVSFLKSFQAPGEKTASDREFLAEKINSTVTGLLNLVGIEADPLNSREHILLTNIFDYYWSNKEDMSLEAIIRSIQKPPMTNVGVVSVESFFPSKDRFALSMKFNNILASPVFSAWTQGNPLEIEKYLYGPNGKPRVSIFSISHLNDSERMFFVSLFLTSLLEWTRSQEGTSSLRAIFYMDEVFGYFPPVANPPSKPPLMSLLKQARAFGLGVILATQNPADIDYKGLSNIGTWFIGKLQTARDKEKLLEGLESAASDFQMTKNEISNLISGIGKRVFLMRNVHEEKPKLFKTRWALSYLRGPITKEQIKILSPKEETPVRTKDNLPEPATVDSAESVSSNTKPLIPESIKEYFIPVGESRAESEKLVYRPVILSIGRLFFQEEKSEETREKKCVLAAPFSKIHQGPEIESIKEMKLDLKDLKEKPLKENAEFSSVPPEVLNAKFFSVSEKAIKDWVQRNVFAEIKRIPSLGEVSDIDEDERDFRIRMIQHLREKRDEEVEKLRSKYAVKMAKLEERERKALHVFEKKKDEVSDQKSQSAISFGSTFLGAFLGGRRISASNLSRAASSVRSVSRVTKKSKEAGRAKENYEKILAEKKSLNTELENDISILQKKFDSSEFEVVREKIFPKKKDIFIDLTCLAWEPTK